MNEQEVKEFLESRDFNIVSNSFRNKFRKELINSEGDYFKYKVRYKLLIEECNQLNKKLMNFSVLSQI